MQIFRHFAAAATALVSLAGIAHADQSPLAGVNWGQAHGMTSAQDGLNKFESVITSANAASLQRKWRKIPSVKLLSTPVVANGRVFVTGQDASLNYNLYALDADTGATLAHFPIINVSGSSPSVALSPPVVAGGIVYVATRNGNSSRLFAFNAANGTAITGAGLTYFAAIGGSGIAAPTVAGGNVYEPAGDSRVYGFNAKTGAVLDNYPIKAAGKFISAAASVVNATVDGATVSDLCVGSADNYMYCFNAQTGDRLFSIKTSGFFDVGGPAVSRGVLYFISWGEHQLRAVDVATGVSKWPSPLKLTFASDSTPAIANNRVVIGDHGGTLYSVSTADGSMKWQKTLDSALDGSAVIANGVIYVNSAKSLYAIDAQNHAVLWHTPNAGGYGMTPVVVNGTVYAASSTGGLSAFVPSP